MKKYSLLFSMVLPLTAIGEDTDKPSTQASRTAALAASGAAGLGFLGASLLGKTPTISGVTEQVAALEKYAAAPEGGREKLAELEQLQQQHTQLQQTLESERQQHAVALQQQLAAFQEANSGSSAADLAAAKTEALAGQQRIQQLAQEKTGLETVHAQALQKIQEEKTNLARQLQDQQAAADAARQEAQKSAADLQVAQEELKRVQTVQEGAPKGIAEQLQQRNAALQQEVDRLTQEAEISRNKAVEEAKKMAKEKEDLAQQLQALEYSKTVLEQKHVADLQSVRNETKRLEEQMQALQTEKRLSEQMNKTALQRLQAEREALQAEKETLTGQRDTALAQKVEFERLANNRLGENQLFGATLAFTNAQKDQAEKQLKNLQEAHGKVVAEHQTALQERDQLAREKQNLQGEHDRLQQIHKNLRDRLLEKNKALAELQSKYDTDIAKSQAVSQSRETALQNYEQRLKSLREEITARDNNYRQLLAQHEKAKTDAARELDNARIGLRNSQELRMTEKVADKHTRLLAERAKLAEMGEIFKNLPPGYHVPALYQHVPSQSNEAALHRALSDQSQKVWATGSQFNTLFDKQTQLVRSLEEEMRKIAPEKLAQGAVYF